MVNDPLQRPHRIMRRLPQPLFGTCFRIIFLIETWLSDHLQQIINSHRGADFDARLRAMTVRVRIDTLSPTMTLIMFRSTNHFTVSAQARRASRCSQMGID